MSRLHLRKAAGVLACLIVSMAVLTGCLEEVRQQMTAPATSATTSTSAAPAKKAPAGVHDQLAELVVSAPHSKDGYERKLFTHWVDQGDNCNTRELVLKKNGKDVRIDGDCVPLSGSWTSPYDNATWTKASDVDIDHMVPLAEAWASGAWNWTQKRRAELANDLTRPQLFAVTDNVNQEKGDKTPDRWKPPVVAYWPTYAKAWIAVKHHYGLTITAAEKKALELMLK